MTLTAGVSVAVAGRTALAECKSVTVSYGSGKARVMALRGVDLEIDAGEHLALVGRSGSGKTTLLHVLGGLLVPTTGMARWKGTPLSSLDVAARGRARAQGIAYVFQGSNLLPHLTAWENVAFASRAAALRDTPGLGAETLLRLVGLGDKADFLPAELSGGESQRVAVARALAQRPELLLCDEPTGHLDSDTGTRVLDMIEALRAELGFALVVATHDPDVAARAERAATMVGGELQGV
jgi:putative ABC transport system ATP-binding protein